MQIFAIQVLHSAYRIHLHKSEEMYVLDKPVSAPVVFFQQNYRLGHSENNFSPYLKNMYFLDQGIHKTFDLICKQKH